MIFITGSNGFVGKNLVNYLEQKKQKYICLKRNKISKYIKTQYYNLNYKVNSKNNCLIHLSSPALVDLYRKKKYSQKTIALCFQAELNNAISLVQFCKKNNFKKLIYISSSSVYGTRNQNKPFIESDVPDPSNHYGKIKHYIEKIIYYCL